MIDLQGFQQLFHYVNQWKTLFQAYDRDQSGAIDKSEFGQVLLQMGYRLSDQSIEALLNKFASKPGQITFDSFIIACVQLHQLTSKCHKVIKLIVCIQSFVLIRLLFLDAFRRFDKQLTGTITIGYEDFVQTVLESI